MPNGGRRGQAVTTKRWTPGRRPCTRAGIRVAEGLGASAGDFTWPVSGRSRERRNAARPSESSPRMRARRCGNAQSALHLRRSLHTFRNEGACDGCTVLSGCPCFSANLLTLPSSFRHKARAFPSQRIEQTSIHDYFAAFAPSVLLMR